MDKTSKGRPQIGKTRGATMAAGLIGAVLGLAVMGTAEARPRPGAHARVAKPAKTPRREVQAIPANRPAVQAQYNPKELGIDNVRNLGDTATHEVGHVRDDSGAGQSTNRRKKWEGPDLDASKNDVAIETID